MSVFVGKILGAVQNRWSCEYGYRNVLILAVPLILSTGAWSIQHFVDRMFLTWYSPETIAAATPAGMVNFTIMSLFIGTASYVNAFVAQYHGAGRFHRIGPAIWQGLYVALIGGSVHLCLIPFADHIFGFVGHDELVRQYEAAYFRVLCLGAAPAIASSALSGFFSGRGKTWPVMWVSVLATAVNIIMDYLLIFGKGGFPELGIVGAGLATVLSACFSFSLYMVLIMRRSYDKSYHTLRKWRFDGFLFKRLLKFGFPNGIHFMLEMAGFTVFILLIGRLGTPYLAATNIAFNINSLAFMPMIGLGMAVTVLVGQHLGENRPEIAEKCTFSGFHIAFFYMSIIAAMYFFLPEVFVAPYASQTKSDSFESILSITVILLRFVAVYSLFDSLTIIFASAIKGAGDTRFVMMMILALSLMVLVIPSYVALEIFNADIYTGWTIASAYIIILGFIFLIRFLGGKWKSMRVIEKAPPPLPPTLPESPVIDFES